MTTKEKADRVEKLCEGIAEAFEGADPAECTQALIAFLAVMHDNGCFAAAPPMLTEPIETFLAAMGAGKSPSEH